MAWKRIGIMRTLKFVLDSKSLETIYLSFIRPLLEYSDVIWSNITLQEEYELEKIQVEACRIITGATNLVSLKNFYSDTGFEPLKLRRNKHILMFFYKISNLLTPQYLSSLVPDAAEQTSEYNLRKANNIRIFSVSYSIFFCKLLPTINNNCVEPITIRLAKLSNTNRL